MIVVLVSFLIALWLVGCFAFATMRLWKVAPTTPLGWPWLIPFWPLLWLWDEGVIAWYRLAEWRAKRRVRRNALRHWGRS